MSRLNVDKITGATGTTSGAPITLSGDTVTLGTGTTLGSGVTNNAGVASGTIGSAVTGTLGTGVTFPSGTIITHTQYSSTTGQDYTGTSEAVYTSIGNPMVFVKKKDASTSKLFFTANVKMFDSVGYHLSLGFRVRKGTNTSGTQIASGDAYDLFHSTNTSPYRTGMNVHLTCDEITDEGAGNFNFVFTAYRNGYSAPQAINNVVLHMYEIII